MEIQDKNQEAPKKSGMGTYLIIAVAFIAVLIILKMVLDKIM